jgi:hypothetical protein
MTEQRRKLRKILTDLEAYNNYEFSYDEIPEIIDKIEEAIKVKRCCEVVPKYKTILELGGSYGTIHRTKGLKCK